MALTKQEISDITKASKSFASGFKDIIPSINNSGWLIVDPLSAYLNACGYKNELKQYAANEKHPLVLLMQFESGEIFIPAGADLKPINTKMKNWFWLTQDNIKKHNIEY